MEEKTDCKKEEDSLGEVFIPASAFYGASTMRSVENFNIGDEKMPIEIIRVIVLIKKAAAIANFDLGKISEDKKIAIVNIAEKIKSGEFHNEFPLKVWQTGSGTQTNMNVNEVIANIANAEKESLNLHPNDDVNMGQSSNDVFPTAMQISTYLACRLKLIPAVIGLKNSFNALSEKWERTIKIGRTHLQDAVPLTFGQEFSAFVVMLEKAEIFIENTTKELLELPIGGTAVGTGINTDKSFGERVVAIIAKETSFDFKTAKNRFYSLSSKSNFSNFHGSLKALATDLMKIANDIRWLSSGPRCGLSEIKIPENEPGSSIMPGKVNPTQAEALTMVCTQVMGNDVTIGLAASQGNFQLNVFMPVIIYNTLQSIRLLTDAIFSFNNKLVIGIKPNIAKIAENNQKSLMLITALSPKIGYDNAAKIAKKAFENGTTLKEESLKTGLITGEEFDDIMDIRKMI
ncbi:MAG: class II fumarate hydratase [Clostridiales Family XIII bacterium]|jgi:fumarate hydratase class II|nr:class II fumarate hydratase [Clostridiales Family XIII bacterium]